MYINIALDKLSPLCSSVISLVIKIREINVTSTYLLFVYTHYLFL